MQCLSIEILVKMKRIQMRTQLRKWIMRQTDL